jgi:lysozyme
VNKAVKVPLKQYEFDAIVSWHYNTGAVATASWIKKLNAGDRAGAIKGIMDWRKPAEIIPRRTAERDLFKTGKYPEPFATIYPAVNGKIQWGQGKRIDLAKALTASPAAEPIKPSTGSISGPPLLDTHIPGAIRPAKPVEAPVTASGVAGYTVQPKASSPKIDQPSVTAKPRNMFLAFIIDAVLPIAKLFGRKR